MALFLTFISYSKSKIFNFFQLLFFKNSISRLQICPLWEYMFGNYPFRRHRWYQYVHKYYWLDGLAAWFFQAKSWQPSDFVSSFFKVTYFSVFFREVLEKSIDPPKTVTQKNLAKKQYSLAHPKSESFWGILANYPCNILKIIIFVWGGEVTFFIREKRKLKQKRQDSFFLFVFVGQASALANSISLRSWESLSGLVGSELLIKGETTSGGS